MKTIYEIQDEYARELGWDSMSDMLVNVDETRESLNFDYVEIAKRYAIEAIKHDRKRIKAMEEIDPEDGLETVAVYRIINLPIELK